MIVRKIAMPVPFENKTVHIKNTNPDTKNSRGTTTPETWKFMKDRYVVLKNFIPKDIIEMSMDMWRVDESTPDRGFMHQETKDITFDNPQSSIGKSHGGYCTPQGVAMHSYLTKKLESFFDMELVETYSYTRKYVRGAYLGSHLDRPSCEVSGTLCLDYQTDDNTPWKIWVRNDKNYVDESAEKVKGESQDLSQRERQKNNCKSISLEPGDLLLYQGPNIPHWRDYLLGDYSYHMFVHWFNRFSKMANIDGFNYGRSRDVGTAPPIQALELDARQHKYMSTNDVECSRLDAFRNFTSHFKDVQAMGNLKEFVNNYDDIELDEKKMEREATK